MVICLAVANTSAVHPQISFLITLNPNASAASCASNKGFETPNPALKVAVSSLLSSN
jgi:hypothetical protein